MSSTQDSKAASSSGAERAPEATERIASPPECPPYRVKPGTPVSTPEETRAAAMAFVEAGKRGNVEEMDATMTPDATMWFAGFGCVDRSQWGPAHYAHDHGPPTFVRVELTSLLVEGDRAVLEMITEQAWPGGGYLKFHSIHLWVSQGKIVSLRQYSADARPLNDSGPLGRG
jgi:hypothetical protein